MKILGFCAQTTIHERLFFLVNSSSSFYFYPSTYFLFRTHCEPNKAFVACVHFVPQKIGSYQRLWQCYNLQWFINIPHSCYTTEPKTEASLPHFGANWWYNGMKCSFTLATFSHVFPYIVPIVSPTISTNLYFIFHFNWLIKAQVVKIRAGMRFFASLWRIKTKFINSIVFEWNCRRTIWIEWGNKYENDWNKRPPWINRKRKHLLENKSKFKFDPLNFDRTLLYFFCFVCFYVFIDWNYYHTRLALSIVDSTDYLDDIFCRVCVLSKSNVQSINELWFFVEVKLLDFSNFPRSKIKIVHFLHLPLSMLCKHGSCRPTWALLLWYL